MQLTSTLLLLLCLNLWHRTEEINFNFIFFLISFRLSIKTSLSCCLLWWCEWNLNTLLACVVGFRQLPVAWCVHRSNESSIEKKMLPVMCGKTVSSHSDRVEGSHAAQELNLRAIKKKSSRIYWNRNFNDLPALMQLLSTYIRISAISFCDLKRQTVFLFRFDIFVCRSIVSAHDVSEFHARAPQSLRQQLSFSQLYMPCAAWCLVERGTCKEKDRRLESEKIR